MALDCTLVDIDSIFHTSVQFTYFYQVIFGTKFKFSENQNTLRFHYSYWVPSILLRSSLGYHLLLENYLLDHNSCSGRWGQWGYRSFYGLKVKNEDFTSRFFNSALCFEKNGRIIKAQFLTESVELRITYFLKNWLMKLKFSNLRIADPQILPYIFLSSKSQFK